MFFSESRITELCFWGDRLEDASWTSWLGIWDGALINDWYFWEVFKIYQDSVSKLDILHFYRYFLYLFTHGRHGKQCKTAVHFLDLILPCSDVHHIVPPRTFKHDHFIPPIVWYSILSLVILWTWLSQKTQGVAWDKHIWSRPTRRNASNWCHWCLRCFWGNFHRWDGQQNVVRNHVVCYMGVSLNGGTQQPWVFLLKMIILDVLGIPPFKETPISRYLASEFMSL